ncbi:MAG: Txe/YoeB family addiction module toxin [Bacteroidales bacterium]|nr:Txe/YoeB family addiction module toxin [Bacteroidales bacterium]
MPVAKIFNPHCRGKYKGFWSRRIDGEHRLIYQVKKDEIWIAKCRFHYD